MAREVAPLLCAVGRYAEAGAFFVEPVEAVRAQLEYAVSFTTGPDAESLASVAATQRRRFITDAADTIRALIAAGRYGEAEGVAHVAAELDDAAADEVTAP